MKLFFTIVVLLCAVHPRITYASLDEKYMRLGYPDERPPVNSDLDLDWMTYKNTFNKIYSDGSEENYRYLH